VAMAGPILTHRTFHALARRIPYQRENHWNSRRQGRISFSFAVGMSHGCTLRAGAFRLPLVPGCDGRMKAGTMRSYSVRSWFVGRHIWNMRRRYSSHHWLMPAARTAVKGALFLRAHRSERKPLTVAAAKDTREARL